MNLSVPSGHNRELSQGVVLASMAGVIPALFLSALDNTIMSTAMPQIIAEFQGFDHYAAVTTVYMLAATVVLPIAGKLSDMYGRKPFLLTGVAIFVIGSALCGSASTMVTLVICRGLQGIGAGLSQGMAFITIADLFPPARRGRVSGIMGAVFGLASVIGPAVGGLLTDGPGWRWCFYVNIPIGIIAFLILFRAFPNLVVSKQSENRIDWLGALTLVLGITPLLLALSWGGREYAWNSTTVLMLLLCGGLMMILFVLVQTRASNGIMPLSLFRDRIVWTASAASVLMSLVMFGATLFVPLYIQGVIGRSAIQSGAVLTPMMLAMITASMTSGQLMTRTGRYKIIAIIGVSITAVGMFLLSRMDISTEHFTVIRNMVIVGFGLGMNLPVFTLAVQNAVDIRQVGLATSSVHFLRSIGGALGSAIFGAVLANRFGTMFYEVLPRDLSASMPAGVLTTFENPQVLMDSTLLLKMEPLFSEHIGGMASALGAVQTALTRSLQDVFLAGSLFAVLGILFAVLLVEIPLRKTNFSQNPPL
tara:strand:+ start:3809 stop:5410 length:1602 start_codon:yes stop_codon:yes gene_type:complete